MRRFLLASALGVAIAASAGCGPSYEAQSTFRSVRVIGVKKSAPYARPGETVKFSLLLHDGAETPRKVSVAWFAGCDNPAADIYPGCFTDTFLSRFATVVEQVSDFQPTEYLGKGFEFSYRLPENIVSKHDAAPGSDKPAYGLSFVFFTVCTGRLEAAPPGEQFPLKCVDENTGERIGADGFVAGYTQVFAYDDLRNTNPNITGFEIDGKGLGSAVECIGSTDLASEDPCVIRAKSDFGILSENPVVDAGAPPSEEPPPGEAVDGGVTCDPDTQAWCIEQCTKDRVDDCPKHYVQPVIDGLGEKDDVAGGGAFEQMWVNYYIDDVSKFDGDIKLLQDSVEGPQVGKSGTKFFAPQRTGPFHVWAAAHDNRGGVNWVRARLFTRTPVER